MTIRKTTLLSCALVTMLGLVAACSDDAGIGAPASKTGSGTGGSSGSGTGGTTGSGGSTGGTTGSGGTTGGTGGSTGGTSGTGGTAGKAGSGGSGGATGGTAGSGGSTGGASGSGGSSGAGTGGTAGAKDAGVADSGRAGSSGSGGAADSGSGGSGGGSNPDAGMGSCGPMRGADPTEASVQTKGAFTVMSYTDAPASTSYKASTIYYPTDATPPFVGIAVVPGFNGMQKDINQWGPLLASHGYVVMALDTNSTSDSPDLRSTALMAAIGTLKAENTRAASALNGKLGTCMVVMGHSMGGGGAIMAANANSAALKAVVGFSPYGAATSSTNVKVPALVFVSTSDALATPAGHVKPAYNGIPAGVNKMYLEFPGSAHDIAQFPTGTRTSDPIVARYGLSWLKFNVDGDTRYRQFLNKVSTGLADYQTTLP